MMPPVFRFLVSCEHGGNRVPAEFAEVFAGAQAQALLRSHRGYDPGALEAAEQIAAELGAPLIASPITRLLVDLNRSVDNAELFSKFSRNLPEHRQQAVLDEYYHPYREAVRSRLASIIQRQGSSPPPAAIHLSVHTFTPRIAGRWRPLDVGLLYDPQSPSESAFCRSWQAAMQQRHSPVRVALNQPYAGTDDGLTTRLRREFPPTDYLGIEIEISNRYGKRSRESQAKIVQGLLDALPLRPPVLPRSSTISETHPLTEQLSDGSRWNEP